MAAAPKSDLPTFQFGSKLVMAEPSWYQFFHSPYYTEHHKAFRAKMRAFVDAHIRPFVNDWEERHIADSSFEMPLDFLRKAHEEGLFCPWAPKEYGGTPPEGGWDAFMDLIWLDEVSRGGSAGPSSAFTIITMALPPLLRGGSPEVLKEVVPQLLSAKKQIALCISEPYAGSDVANIRGTAKKDGDYYIISAEKKWITMGIFADYFTVAVRTGPAGPKGLSLFLIDRNAPGVSVKRMKLQGHWISGTSMVLFNDVKVHKSRMIGEENKGFRMIMHNFNHERFVIAVQANRGSRRLLEACMVYASRRKTFNKTLLEHQVIRQKMADMAMRIEAVQALIETVTYQMKCGVSNERLGGVMALLKVNASRTLELCCREASQVYGGASFVRGGVGQQVERAARDVRGVVVPGGSDEILADLAVRQAMLITARAQMEGAKL